MPWPTSTPYSRVCANCIITMAALPVPWLHDAVADAEINFIALQFDSWLTLTLAHQRIPNTTTTLTRNRGSNENLSIFPNFTESQFLFTFFELCSFYVFPNDFCWHKIFIEQSELFRIATTFWLNRTSRTLVERGTKCDVGQHIRISIMFRSFPNEKCKTIRIMPHSTRHPSPAFPPCTPCVTAEEALYWFSYTKY